MKARGARVQVLGFGARDSRATEVCRDCKTNVTPWLPIKPQTYQLLKNPPPKKKTSPL